LDRAIIVFSKSADRGRVKTRLRSVISDDDCVSLAMALLQDTIEKMQLIIDADPYLYLSGSTALNFTPSIPVRQQIGVDLGERMLHAFEETLSRYAKVLIVGTDSPLFPPQIFEEAFAALDTHDVVLGPAEDGGYYLIGMKEAVREIFSDIPWGTREVLARTLLLLKHRTVKLLAPAFDIDEPKDLDRFRAEVARTEASYLKNCRRWLDKIYSAT
jgi:rSAM/selenodomain-associated transferase 1